MRGRALGGENKYKEHILTVQGSPGSAAASASGPGDGQRPENRGPGI